MNIVEKIKEYVKDECNKHKKESKDGYDFWNEHIKYVYDKAVFLAKKYGADIEIVSLGTLLHDIALIKKVGRRSDHHINGAKIAERAPITIFIFPLAIFFHASYLSPILSLL